MRFVIAFDLETAMYPQDLLRCALALTPEQD